MIRFNSLQPPTKQIETAEPQKSLRTTDIQTVNAEPEDNPDPKREAIQSFMARRISASQLMDMLIHGNTGNAVSDLFLASTSETSFVSPLVQFSPQSERSIPPPFTRQHAVLTSPKKLSFDEQIQASLKARNLGRFFQPSLASSQMENPLAELLKQQGLGNLPQPSTTMPSPVLDDDTQRFEPESSQVALEQNPSPQEVAELARIVDDRKVLSKRIDDDARRAQQRDDDSERIRRTSHDT